MKIGSVVPARRAIRPTLDRPSFAVIDTKRSASSPIPQLVEDYLRERTDEGCSKATIDNCYGQALRQVFLPFLAKQGISKPSQLQGEEVMRKFLTELRARRHPRTGKPLSPFSVQSYLRSTKWFVNWLAKNNHTGAVVVPEILTPKRLVEVLTRAEIDKLEAACELERDKLIIRTLADTGIRVGELRGITLHNVHMFGRDYLLKVEGKGSKDRLVPLTPALYRRLIAYGKSIGRGQHEPLFQSSHLDRSTGEAMQLTKSGIEQLLGRAAYRAKLDKRVYPHILRHSFATYCLQRGMDVITLAKILGHSSLIMIQKTYAHLNSTDSARALMAVLRSVD